MLRPALALVLLLLGTAAADDDRDAEARALFKRGRQEFNERHFSEAHEFFRRAYHLSEKPALLFDMSRALEEGGRPHDAAEQLRAYLRIRPADPDRPALEERIAALEEKQRSADAERRRVSAILASPLQSANPAPPRRTGLIVGVSLGAAAVATLALGLGLGLGLHGLDHSSAALGAWQATP